MIFKLKLGHWKLTITFAPVVDVVGVNSLLPDGKHILMWDFDDTTELQVIRELKYVQQVCDLPNIYILETLPSKNFVAYCFKRCEWSKAVEVIAMTKGVCWNFFKWGVFRHRFTLRVSPKCGRVPRLVLTLHSTVPEDASIPELRSWVKYETMPDGYQGRMMKIG